MSTAEQLARDRAAQALIDKWMTREFGQFTGYLRAVEIVDIVLDAYRQSTTPAQAPNCGSYACKAAQRDGVLCADGECDIEAGIRPAKAPARPAKRSCNQCTHDDFDGSLYMQCSACKAAAAAQAPAQAAHVCGLYGFVALGDVCPGCEARKPAQAAEPVDIESIISDHLTSVYVCNRVWEAWSVGTMTEDDFVPARETEFVAELAAAIRAALAAPHPSEPAATGRVWPGEDDLKREFYAGICVALTAITGFDNGVLWAEIVRSCGDGLIYHAAHVEPDEWELSGFAKYLWPELKKRKPRARTAPTGNAAPTGET